MGSYSSRSYARYRNGDYFSIYARFSRSRFTSSSNYGSSGSHTASRVSVDYTLMLYMGSATGSCGAIKSRGYGGFIRSYISTLDADRLFIASYHASKYARFYSRRPMTRYSRSRYYGSWFRRRSPITFSNCVAGEDGRFMLRSVSHLIKFPRGTGICEMGSSLYRSAYRGSEGSRGYVWGSYRGSYYRAYGGYGSGYGYEVRAYTSRRGYSYATNYG